MVDPTPQPPSSSPSPGSSSTNSTPPSSRKRKFLIIGGIVVAVVLLIVVIVASLLMLQSSSDEGGSSPGSSDSPGLESGEGTGEGTGLLPRAGEVTNRFLNIFRNNDEGTSEEEEEDPLPYTSDPVDEEELSIDELVSDDGESYEENPVLPTRLAVDVSYTRGETFDLEITRVARTQAQTTIEDYLPIEGEPYSLFQVIDEQGRTILAKPFGISTTVIFDGVDVPVGPAQLDFSTASLVAELPGNTPPARVLITTAGGTILDEESFVFEELPEEAVGTESLSPSSSAPSLLRKMTGVLGISSADAQEDRPFKLVVINAPGASVGSGSSAAVRMINFLEPWSDFTDEIEIVRLQNEKPLSETITGPDGTTVRRGCRITTFQGRDYPICDNDSIVRQIVQEKVPEWDAIIVVMDVVCNCGTVASGMPPITAIGSGTTSTVLMHELGHAVGKMTDEYFGDLGISGAQGPNCFSSQQACEAALNKFENVDGGECSQNCNSPATWRPANRIMYNQYEIEEFGPVEKCLMGNRLAEEIGTEYQCKGLSSGDFWGWYRGGLYDF